MTTVQRIYNDLLEFFGDDRILENDKEFKAWLERVAYNNRKVNELFSELKKLKAASKDAISRQAVMELPRYTTVIGEIVYLDDIKALPPVYPKVKAKMESEDTK